MHFVTPVLNQLNDNSAVWTRGWMYELSTVDLSLSLLKVKRALCFGLKNSDWIALYADGKTGSVWSSVVMAATLNQGLHNPPLTLCSIALEANVHPVPIATRDWGIIQVVVSLFGITTIVLIEKSLVDQLVQKRIGHKICKHENEHYRHNRDWKGTLQSSHLVKQYFCHLGIRKTNQDMLLM